MRPKTCMGIGCRRLRSAWRHWLADELPWRVDQHRLASKPPLHAIGKALAVHSMAEPFGGDVDQRLILTEPIDQAGLAGALPAQYQIPRQLIDVFAAHVFAQGSQTLIQRALLQIEMMQVRIRIQNGLLSPFSLPLLMAPEHQQRPNQQWNEYDYSACRDPHG